MSTEGCTGKSEVKMMMLAGALPASYKTCSATRGSSSRLLQVTGRGAGALPLRGRAAGTFIRLRAELLRKLILLGVRHLCNL